LKLSEKQIKLCHALNSIERWAFGLGYDLVREDAYRNPVVHGEFGIKKSYAAAYSVHKLKLAQDYSVFRNGKYVTGEEANRVFNLMHDHADTLGLAERIPGDLGHFSMEHQGHR